jgi:hypothetical protein
MAFDEKLCRFVGYMWDDESVAIFAAGKLDGTERDGIYHQLKISSGAGRGTSMDHQGQRF